MKLDTDILADKILGGDRRAFSRAITLVESTKPDDRKLAGQLLEKLMPHTGNSFRLGVTGAPGVGKSSFIEAIGQRMIKLGHRLAVLAIDPSSRRTGGSILGDKIRMENLAREPQAFIRPSPTGAFLGGVAKRTHETMLLCEAAGFDLIIIETVGVGQSESMVSDMVDMFALMLLPGGGDELQGIKRGIVELADMIIVNKADGNAIDNAEQTARDYGRASHLLQPRHKDWSVPVVTCSVLKNTGLDDICTIIDSYKKRMDGTDVKDRMRSQQALDWLWREVGDNLIRALHEDEVMRHRIEFYEDDVSANRLSAPLAADKMVHEFLGGLTKRDSK